MAIWAAAHLSFAEGYEVTAEKMHQDEFFQELIIDNLLGGGRLSFKAARGDRLLWRRLLLARVLVKHDHVIAAQIAGRVYEELLRVFGKRCGLHVIGKKLWEIEEELGEQPELQRFGVTAADLNRWRDWRNESAHVEKTIRENNARQFVNQISDFQKKV
ncbi:MAG: hypothetical protein ACREQW_04520 [Candidatus Binatia bacterium]